MVMIDRERGPVCKASFVPGLLGLRFRACDGQGAATGSPPQPPTEVEKPQLHFPWKWDRSGLARTAYTPGGMCVIRHGMRQAAISHGKLAVQSIPRTDSVKGRKETSPMWSTH